MAIVSGRAAGICLGRPKPYRRIGLRALCVLLVLAARYVLSIVQYGAALPFNVGCFSWVQPTTFSTTPGSTPAV